MRILFISLLFLLFSTFLVNAEEETPTIVKTEINVSIRGYYDVNLNDTRVNISIFTVDGVLNYNALSNSSEIFERKEINFVRLLSCPASNITRLAESVEALNNDIICEGESCAKRWADCKVEKAHVEGIQNQIDKELAMCVSERNNATDCEDKKEILQASYSNVQKELNELKTNKSASESYWIYALLFGAVAGAGVHWGFGGSVRKDNPRKTPSERQGVSGMYDSERLMKAVDELKHKQHPEYRGEPPKEYEPRKEEKTDKRFNTDNFDAGKSVDEFLKKK